MELFGQNWEILSMYTTKVHGRICKILLCLFLVAVYWGMMVIPAEYFKELNQGHWLPQALTVLAYVVAFAGAVGGAIFGVINICALPFDFIYSTDELNWNKEQGRLCMEEENSKQARWKIEDKEIDVIKKFNEFCALCREQKCPTPKLFYYIWVKVTLGVFKDEKKELYSILMTLDGSRRIEFMNQLVKKQMLLSSPEESATVGKKLNATMEAYFKEKGIDSDEKLMEIEEEVKKDEQKWCWEESIKNLQ